MEYSLLASRKHTQELHCYSYLIFSGGGGFCGPPTGLFTLWAVVVKECRWACSELVMNCGPNSSHFSGTTKSLYRSADQIEKLPTVAEMSLWLWSVWAPSGFHPGQLSETCLAVLSPLAVLSHLVSKVPSFKDLTTFSIRDDCLQFLNWTCV